MAEIKIIKVEGSTETTLLETEGATDMDVYHIHKVAYDKCDELNVDHVGPVPAKPPK